MGTPQLSQGFSLDAESDEAADPGLIDSEQGHIGPGC